MYTKAELINQIKGMGIKPDDTVVIHTSMRAVGKVEGGADTVIDAFCECLTDGLFVVPTHTWDRVYADQPVFDVKNTESCLGALPNCAVRSENGCRSLHPTHSVWAYGKNANEFIKGEEKATTPAPQGSVWARLGDVGAKILLIGVSHDKNTFIHSVDEFANVPDRLNPDGYNTVLIDKNGNRINGVMHGHKCSKCDDVSKFYVNFDKAFTKLEAQTFGKLGNATVRVVDARKCRETVLRIYSRISPDICTDYNDIPEEIYMPE